MKVHVLLYEVGNDNEGVHSLELQGKTVVLMFEDLDDAERYCGLLEAQDFPRPTAESIERNEIEEFCSEAGYEARFVESGFMPKSEEDLLLLVPPEASRDVSNWNSNDSADQESLDQIKKRLEGLL